MAKKMNNNQYGSEQSSDPTKHQQHSNISTGKATAVADKPAVKQTKKASAPTYEQIADRARSIWQERGCPTNQDESIWYEAEKQIKQEQNMY